MRTVVFYGPVSKEPNHLVFLFMRKSWWESFFFVFGIAVYEVRERESIKERRHWKQDFLKRPSQCRPCAVIWSVLTELSRGMEKIIRRNVWGALKRSGPRDWPMGEGPAERRANFFLMNSNRLLHNVVWLPVLNPHMVCIWRLQMTGSILPAEKRGAWAWDAFLFFHFIKVKCSCVVVCPEVHQCGQYPTQVLGTY